MSRAVKIWHVVVAGGSGMRFGAELPKQLCELDGIPVLVRTVDALRRATPQAGIVIAMHPDYIRLWSAMCDAAHIESPNVVPGGSTRWESVRNALGAVPPDADIVTVHDAARPLVPADLVDRVVQAVIDGAAGAVPAVPVTDSLRITDGDSSHAVDRALFRAVQTPQAFSAPLLRQAYALPYRPEFTDDASVMEAAGFPAPELVEGSVYNIKITHPADMKVAGLYLEMMRH